MTVSIGTVHGMYMAGVKSDLQIDLIKDIRAAVTNISQQWIHALQKQSKTL